MQEEKRIKQDSPKNILWRLFRINTEKVMIPQETEERNQEFIKQIMREK